MFAIFSEQVYSGNGKDVRRVVIQADETPNSFPTTGEGIGGLQDTTILAPGSVIHCVDSGKNYLMNEAGTDWNEDGGSST